MKPINYYVDTPEIQVLMATFGSRLEHVSFDDKALMLALLSNSVAFSRSVRVQIESESAYSELDASIQALLIRFEYYSSVGKALDLIRAIAETMTTVQQEVWRSE